MLRTRRWRRAVLGLAIGLSCATWASAAVRSPSPLPAGLPRDDAAPAAGTWLPGPVPPAPPPPFTTPPAMHGHTAILDSPRHRMVVFGGYNIPGFVRFDETWVFSLGPEPGWTRLLASGPPTARFGHTAIYDPVRDRMLVFGGEDGSPVGDLWQLTLGGTPQWTRILAPGPAPSARYGHTAFYDPVRDRMIVFGGFDGNYLNDAYQLSLSGAPTWSRLFPSGTPPAIRDFHSAIYDPVRDRMLVFGGNNGAELNDLWAMSLGGTPAWTRILAAGPLPPVRLAHRVAYDAAADRMIVFGGWGAGVHRNDTWALALAGTPTWSALAAGGAVPTPRHSHGAVLDPIGARFVVFGGTGGSSLADTYTLTLTGPPVWSLVGAAPPGAVLQPRHGHSAILDPQRNQMVVYGGEQSLSGSLWSDVWRLTLGPSPAWEPVQPAGPSPRGRVGHSAIHDPVRDRMLVFGGFDGDYRNDLWGLSLAGDMQWSPVAALGAPPARRNFHSAIYDPVRDRMIVFGGNLSSVFLDDVWALSLGGTPTWTQLTPAGPRPAPRLAHKAIYDPGGDRMLVFGGFNSGYECDLWELPLAPGSSWSLLSPQGQAPSARYSHTAVFDEARNRMVVFGGNSEGLSTNDLYQLALGPGALVWKALRPSGEPPLERHGHSAIHDGPGDRMVVFGGHTSGAGKHGDAWFLSWGRALAPLAASREPAAGDAGVDVPRVPRLGLAGFRPSPAIGRARVAFSLPDALPARLELLDLAGRLIHAREVGHLGPGAHELDLHESSRLPAGVFFIRLVRPDRVLVARGTIVR